MSVRALTTMLYSALPVAVVRSSGRSSALQTCTTIVGPHVGRPAVRHLAQDHEAQAGMTQHLPESQRLSGRHRSQLGCAVAGEHAAQHGQREGWGRHDRHAEPEGQH